MEYIKRRKELIQWSILNAADLPLDEFGLEIVVDEVYAYAEIKLGRSYPLSRMNFITYDGMRIRALPLQRKFLIYTAESVDRFEV